MSSEDDAADGFASVLHGLAALIGAGAPPLVAWRALVARFGDEPIVARVAKGRTSDGVAERLIAALRWADGEELRYGRRLSPPAVRWGWAEVAALWLVVESCGAPVGRALAESATTAIGRVEARRQVDRALASARMTGRVLSFLPVIGLGLVSILGFDLWTAVTSSPVVGLALALAGGLTAWSVVWRSRMTTMATRDDDCRALVVRLVALAVEAGVPTPLACDEAVRAVSAALPEAAGGSGKQALDGLGIVADVLRVAENVGAPVGRLLLAESERLRRTSHAEALKRAVALEGRQLLPLGVCDLPAFLLAGVVPAVVSLFGG